MPAQTSPEWLDEAASKGSTKWLQQFIYTYLAQLERGMLTAEAFANELEEEFASRMLDTPKKQKNYRSNVVQALKVLDPDHPAIPLVGLSTDEYRALNDEQKARVADRETRFIHPDAVETVVEIATNLLESDEWSDVGAGLAVLIGRRISEILLSSFALQTPWSLHFSGMAKKAEETDITIEIPTLAPASVVLAAISRLQTSLRIHTLKAGRSPRQAKQKVNQIYSGAIAQKCDEYFSGLVPNRSDKDNLYTHIFRAVYATIAAHWYCPPSVPEHQFKAEIQGHFTIAADGTKLPNYAARSNYDDYAIGDGQGNRDGRLGIKLGQVEGLQVIAAFCRPQEKPVEIEATTEPEPLEERQEASTMTETDTAKLTIKRPQIYANDLEHLTTLMAQAGVTGTTAELLHALLHLYEQKQEQQQQSQVETVSEVAQTFNWFTSEIERLRAQINDLQADRDRLAAQQPDHTRLNQLKTENAQLKTQLSETQAQLDGIHQLLRMPKADAEPTHTATTIQPAVSTQPAVSNTAAKATTTTERDRDRGGATAKVEAIIQDIINWNTAQPSNDTRLRISVSIIKALGGLVSATYQPAIMEALKSQETAIEEVHQRFMLGARHNVSVDKDTVLQTIARDYMGVPNWQEAKY